MLLLVGDNEDQLLDAFNVDTDSFYNEVTISITGSDQYSTFVHSLMVETMLLYIRSST